MAQKPLFFESKFGRIPLPVFFPDATRGVVRATDSTDLQSSKTPGILVNTYHLYRELGSDVLKKYRGIRNFMNYSGGAISDSGGFQVMSIVKKDKTKGTVIDRGVIFRESKKRKIIFTPEKSIDFQFDLMSDMVVVLDDFTDPSDDYEKAKESVERTILWAKRSKLEFEKMVKQKKLKKVPYLLGVVQGGYFQDLRKYCCKKLVEIGFDGLGFGGWPIQKNGEFDYESARTIVENTPKNYFLYGLGVGKPQEIVNLVKMGFNIFDCVLPTRDARHGRLYVYNFSSIDEINLETENFYSFYSPDKQKYFKDDSKVSSACDCILCKNYSKGYLYHLFKIKELSALRLATIHNLRFYSILMEKLEGIYKKS